MLSRTYVHTFCCYDFGISGIYIINMMSGSKDSIVWSRQVIMRNVSDTVH